MIILYIFVVTTLLKELQIDVSIARHTHLPRTWRTDDLPPDTITRLWYVKSGRAAFWINDVQFDMRPGGVYLIPAFSRVRWQAETTVDLFWIHFSITIYGGMDLFHYFNVSNKLHPNAAKKVAPLFSRITRLFPFGSASAAFEGDAMLRLLLAPFLATVSAHQPDFQPKLLVRFQPVLQYINQHLENEIRVSDLARHAHLEYSYFSRTFKKTFGISLSGHLLRCRIRKAQGLLLQSNAKLALIARQTGFADEQHLAKSFRRITGRTTSQFRAHAIRNMP